MKTILGLDIGTSSVKCCVLEINLFDPNSYIIKSQSKCSYHSERIKSIDSARIPSSYSQQNVCEIISTIAKVLSDAKVSDFKLDLISVCGQQHGCVLWNHETIFFDKDDNSYDLNYNSISDHVDWTDGRCCASFLNELPIPNCYSDKVSTGYGCATLFWYTRMQPEIIQKYNRAGTIMDFFTSILCRNDQVQMSEHNSHNWGYYDPEKETWTMEVLVRLYTLYEDEQ